MNMPTSYVFITPVNEITFYTTFYNFVLYYFVKLLCSIRDQVKPWSNDLILETDLYFVSDLRFYSLAAYVTLNFKVV